MIDKLLEIYGHPDSEENFHLSVTQRETDNGIALSYLEKYHLPEEEYIKNWKPIQNIVFSKKNKSLPEMVFNKGFSLLAIRGGVLFEKEDFENLQRCIEQMGDKNLFIIQNDFGGKLKSFPLRMRYPSNITWEKLTSGNFISTALLEMSYNEYFVFSESGNFEQSPEEWEEIKEWLPPKYKEIIK